LSYLLKAAQLLERQAAKTRASNELFQLSGQLLHWGEGEAAIHLARTALRYAPSSPLLQNHLALCLSRMNRHEEALPFCQQACVTLPDDPGCNTLLAILEARQGKLLEARERLEKVASGCRVPELTARANLELGKLLDRLGEYSAAFTAFSRAAEEQRLLPQNRMLDSHYIFSYLERNKAGFNQEWFASWPVERICSDGLPTPVFLIGFLRSGTTLAGQVLAAHPDIQVSDERDFMLELNLELAKLSGIRADSPGALRKIGLDGVRQLRQWYWQRIREEYGETTAGRVFVDKNALNTLELGLIGAVFPEAKILFALRDPRDVCLSCYMHDFAPSPATVNLLSLEGIARQYAAVMDFWLHLRTSFAPHYLELRYEDGVKDFATSYRKVFDFLGVEWRSEVADFHRQAKDRFTATPSFSEVSQPLYQNAVSRWTHYADRLESILPTIDRFIDAFDYPKDHRYDYSLYALKTPIF
jgi:tetratricopeptide (TPR) repeat protein